MPNSLYFNYKFTCSVEYYNLIYNIKIALVPIKRIFEIHLKKLKLYVYNHDRSCMCLFTLIVK